MIFITVGTQLPFERLITIMDEWAELHPNVEIFAQIGPSKYRPKHVSYSEFVNPSEANKYFEQADLIVSHAGMGSILTSLKNSKPIIIVPRIASLHEHRNDHQLATAKWLGNKPGVFVGEDRDSIFNLLNRRNELINKVSSISSFAPVEFTTKISNFIHN